MGLEAFYPKDIIGAVEAIRHATKRAILAAQAKKEDDYARGHQDGYEDGHQVALDAILMAFNLLRVPEDDNRSILSIPE